MKKYRFSNNPEDYYNNAITKYNLEDFTGALSDLNEAIEMKPDYAEAYFSRGLLYGKEMHKYNKAIKDFNKAIKLNPNYAEAYYNRGVTHRIMDDLKNAYSDWYKAEELGYGEAKILIEKYNKLARK